MLRSSTSRSVSAFGVRLALVGWLGCAGATQAPDAASVDDPIEQLRQYLRYDTSNPPGNEGPAAAYLASVLNRHGITTQRFVSPAGRTSLVARLEAGAPDGEGALVLLHHVDVVPAGDGWKIAPFGGELEDGVVWGRGAIDAKSLGIAQLQAFLAAAEQRSSLRRDLVLVAAADEETGGAQGVSWLLEAHPEVFADSSAVLNEGGANRVIGERLLWWGIEVVQKRPLWLRLTARGRGGHASGYHPWSPTHSLLQALQSILAIPHEERVDEAAWIFFHAIADFHPEQFQEIFAQPSPEAATRALEQHRGQRSALMPGMEVYLQDTVQVTGLKSGGDSINVVAPEASATLDVRLLPDTDEARFLERLREAAGPGIEVEVLLSAPPQSPSPTDTDTYRTLADALDSAPVVPAFILGTTDSRFFRERGIAAYGFWPFLLGGDDNRGIHGRDEGIPVRKFQDGVDLMKRVVLSLVLRDSRENAS